MLVKNFLRRIHLFLAETETCSQSYFSSGCEKELKENDEHVTQERVPSVKLPLY